MKRNYSISGFLFSSFAAFSLFTASALAQTPPDPTGDDILSSLDSLFSGTVEETPAPEGGDTTNPPTDSAPAQDTSSQDTPSEDSSTNATNTSDTSTENQNDTSETKPMVPKREKASDADPASFLARVPGAFKYRGNTYLNLRSQKSYHQYVPCNVDDSQVLLKRLIRLRLMLGNKKGCREASRYLFLPYRWFPAKR